LSYSQDVIVLSASTQTDISSHELCSNCCIIWM